VCGLGFSAYAVRLLQDVYFLDWLLDAPASLQTGQEIGSIESKKAESSLYAPASGQLLAFNDSLMDDPSAINTDKYGEGWLFELETDETFLKPQEYLELLDEVWVKTQRTIKGQL
jgi:glycine cleavage system H protein